MNKFGEISGCIFGACIILLTVYTYDYVGMELLARFLVLLVGVSVCVGVFSCFGAKTRWNVLDGVSFFWWIYILCRVYFQQGIPCCKEVVTYTSLFLLYMVCRFANGCFEVRISRVQWILLCAVGYELLLGLWQVYSRTSRHPLYPVTGSFFNPGPYSAFVAMGMVISIYCMSQKCSKMYKWVNAFILVAGSLMLVLTQSRSAIVVVGLMMCYQYRLVLQRYRWGLLAAVVIGGSALFYYKFESAMGRIVLWWQSVGIWLEHPIIGCGVGGFKGEYGQQLETFFSVKEHIDSFAQYADTTEFAFCDGLQLLAEQGVIGGLFCLLVLLLSLRKLYANERVLFFAFASLLVFCLFSYPFQLLPYQILAVVFVARAARYVGGKESPVWVNPLCLVMAAVLSYTCYGTIKARNDAYQEYKQFAGIIHESFIKDYYRLCPLCLDDKQFLFDFAKILQEKHRYLDSNAILRDGILISNDPMFWVLMGNNYKLMKLYVEAEKCYDTAYSRMPNRLYPLYKKMLLFEDIGNKSAMINVAKDIRKFHEKVSSPAVEEMKRKAETLLEQNRNLN